MPTFCSFCDEEAYLPHCVSPVMCEKHLELVILISHLARNNRPVTPANVQDELLMRLPPMSLEASEVPGLMKDFIGRWKM